MAKTAQEIIQEANDRIKEDISDTFADVKLPEDEDEETKAKAKEQAEKEVAEKEAAEKKAEAEADAKLSDEERAVKEEAKKVAEAEVQAEKDAKVKAEKEAEDKKKDEKGEDEDEVLTQLQSQNEALMTQIEELSGQIFAGPDPIEKDDKKSDDKKDDKKDDKAETEDKKLSVPEFVNQESFEEATSSPGGLNALLARVVEVATQEGARIGYERAIRETPALVDSMTEKTMNTREAVRDFLSENKDLIPVRAYVGLETNKLRAENPDWPLEKLFNEAGKAVRERLKFSKVVEEVNEDKSTEDKAAFTKRGAGGGGKGRSDTKSKLTPLQEEINDLAEVASTRG